MTRVRLVTAGTVLGAFALISVFVAAACVGGQNRDQPTTGAPSPAQQEVDATKGAAGEPVDAKQFRLILTNHGESQKPYYNLILGVQHGAQQHNPFSLSHDINEEQAARIIKELSASGFFKHAQVTDNQNDPKTGPQYLLRVRIGDRHYQETLGWDVGTLLRLGGLRRVLDGEAAKSMDTLLARLDGERKAWESGTVVNGLKTTLSTEQTTRSFAAGRPIPIKLELTNVGAQDRQYGQHPFISTGTQIVVIDEHGRRVPFRGGGAGVLVSQMTIKPAETKVIESCDLSSYYYLRRPGAYTVAFRAAGMPPSNSLRFEVTPDAAAKADGDPMGRLLSLESATWSLEGNPNASAKIRPARNRAEAPGWKFTFVDPGTGTKGSRTFISLWLTDKPTEEEKIAPPENEHLYLPPSEYLGKISRWHVYFLAPARALTAWPTAKEDIKNALDKKSDPASRADGAANDADYRLLRATRSSLC